MAVRKLKDDDGKVYDVEIPDETEGQENSEDDDDDTIYLDEEDIEWLRRKRREESEASRTSQKTTTQTSDKKTDTSGKIIKIRAKQKSPSTDSKSATMTRKRTLRLG